MLAAEIDFSGFACEKLVRHDSGDTLRVTKGRPQPHRQLHEPEPKSPNEIHFV